MNDLFSTNDGFERIPMSHANVSYQRQFDLGLPDARLLAELIDQTPWRQEKVTVWGKSHLQPRLVAWYGDPGKVYTYSGVSLAPLPWSARLMDLRRRVQDAVGASFNSVLLNYYRDNRDGMGFHSDDERELGPEPLIASLSIGDPRVFVFKSKSALEKDVKIVLDSGSLLLMGGETQLHWKHGIPKETRSCGPRVNLTFRRIVGDEGG